MTSAELKVMEIFRLYGVSAFYLPAKPGPVVSWRVDMQKKKEGDAKDVGLVKKKSGIRRRAHAWW